MNDSRDAWEIPAPDVRRRRDRGLSRRTSAASARRPSRGCWPGGEAMVDDARAMAAHAPRAAIPACQLVLMGESMGGAVLMCLATAPRAPQVDGYVLVAPAVWGRAKMNVFLRSGLWLACGAGAGPGAVSGAPVRRDRERQPRRAEPPVPRPADHPKRRASTRCTGLVDLMDAALAAAPASRRGRCSSMAARTSSCPSKRRRRRGAARCRGGERRLAFYPDGYHLMLRDLGAGRCRSRT